MCHSADSLPSVLIKSSRVKSVSWSLSPYTNTPAIWKQVTGGVTVIEEGLWTLINPSVCCYHWKSTARRRDDKKRFWDSHWRWARGIWEHFCFFLQRSLLGDRWLLQPAPAGLLWAGMAMWKELLFNLWPLILTLHERVKRGWQKMTSHVIKNLKWKAGKRRKSSS